WKEGEFRFVPEAIAQSEEIGLGTESLLLETARLMDESGAGEREIAASLEKIDELSRTFADISEASHGRGPQGSDTPEAWVNAVPGRSLFHMTGHALMGREPGGQVTLLDEERSPDPGRILHLRIDGPPHNDWTQRDGVRLYLSWGSEGYRLVHPFPRPAIERHLRDMAAIEQPVDAAAPGVTIYGPPNSGKSLLAALLVSARSANGGRVLYLSGVPSHDLGDGRQIFHVVAAPGSQLVAAREVLARWHPESVVTDMEPSEELVAFLRSCKAGGIPIVLTLRAQELQWAQQSIACLFDQTSGWRFLAPSQVEAGPVLEIRQCAA
ncbi:MAG: hypothetical protein KAY24_18425, partial [Candidatus Eisenbacteria sp.]|nr:hypothetical protein [Candidatus Eisenbacteria bacterium]